MNERIRELAEQAGFMVDQSGSIMVCFTSNGDSEVKKFAELILQDIDKIVDDLYQVLPLEQAAVLITLDENIKGHFYEVKE